MDLRAKFHRSLERTNQNRSSGDSIMTPAQITRQFPFEIDEIVLKGYFISLFYFSNILYLNSFLCAMI
jgi:hypothetical protein